MGERGVTGRADPRRFPRPYHKNDNLDFSFSGLKTAMQTHLASHPELIAGWNADSGKVLCEKNSGLPDICASYRLAVVETLVAKTRKALLIPEMKDIRNIVLAGGVAANSFLRSSLKRLSEEYGLDFSVPSPGLCTDNGAMIAWLGYKLASCGYTHDFNLEAIARGRKIPDDMIRCA